MPRIAPVHYRDLVKVLKKFGFQEASIQGSHLKMRKRPYVEGSPHLIIPIRPKGVRAGLIRSIIRKAGISRDEYFKALDK